MYNPDNYLHIVGPVRLLANYLLFFFPIRDLYIYTPDAIGDLKDPIQNQDRVSVLWTELHIAHAPYILLF